MKGKTNSLPNDYSRCTNADCPLKKDCLRWLDKGEDFVWYADFKCEDGKCENQIKIT